MASDRAWASAQVGFSSSTFWAFWATVWVGPRRYALMNRHPDARPTGSHPACRSRMKSRGERFEVKGRLGGFEAWTGPMPVPTRLTATYRGWIRW